MLSATAGGEPGKNQYKTPAGWQYHALPNCGAVIGNQTDKGVAAGGGPKAGIPAPTNCDHFFQDVGAVGNGTPPGIQKKR